MAKTISQKWVAEHNNLLKQKLPDKVQTKLYYPDDAFYIPYYQAEDKTEGLHYMAAQLFDWLDIEPNKCMIDFYSEEQLEQMGGDTAGFYTKIQEGEHKGKEVIMINRKHEDDAFAVGAVLAHELMHLYLFRLGLKLEDTQENELLTDLATIRTGLSVLIVNGMHYQSQWWLSLILLAVGRLYWSSETQAFGYFKPKQYGKHAREDLSERGVAVEDVLGYMNPTSRMFIKPTPFTRRQREPTELVKILERKNRKSNLIKGSIAGAVIIAAFWWYGQEPEPPPEIAACQSGVAAVEQQLEALSTQVEQSQAEVDRYDRLGDIARYNRLVDPHNALVDKYEREFAAYERMIDTCNTKVDEYNSSL